MTEFEFAQGDEPAIRRAVDDGKDRRLLLPLCGAPAFLLSKWTDLPIDTERVEVYYDNKPSCEAKEIMILIKAGAGAHRRADVSALRVIDKGTPSEQEAAGSIVDRDETGNVTGSALSLDKASKARSRGERDNEILERRRRPTRVTVEPVEEDE